MNPKHSPTCTTCGYDLAGLEPDSTCPECGATHAGIIVDVPLTLRRWAADAGRFILAPRRSLRRPIVRGRADLHTAVTNLVLGSTFILFAASLPTVADEIREAMRYSWKLGTTGDVTRAVFFCFGLSAAGGAAAGTLLAAVHQALVLLIAALRGDTSRVRSRAILAASSFPVLIVGMAAAAASLPVFAAVLLRIAPLARSGTAASWSAMVIQVAAPTAIALLIAATLISGSATRARARSKHPVGSAGPLSADHDTR